MSVLQTTIWDICKLLTLGTVNMAQLALPPFLGSVRGTGFHPCRPKSNHKTSPFAAKCRLLPPHFFATAAISIRYGGSVWESNPPFDPRRTESPALKAGKVTGLFSP